MLRLARFLKDYKIQVILGPLFKLTEAIFELFVPLIVAQIIDVGLKETKDEGYIYYLGGLLFLLAAAGLACALTCQYFASRASQGVGTTIRNKLYEKINTFSHAQLDKFGTHSLVTRITSDANQIQLAVAMLIRLVSRAPFLAAGSMIMAMTINLQASIIILIATPLISGVIYLVSRKTVPVFKRVQKELDGLSLITRENLEGVRVIRAFGNQELEKQRFDVASDQLSDSLIFAGKLNALLNPVTTLIANCAIIAIIWFGGIQVNFGTMTTGNIVAFISYMSQTLLAVIVVSTISAIFTKASASSARINEVFDIQPSILDGDAEVTVNPSAPVIELSNVSFSYEGSGEDTLRNISFSINEGEAIGIIGGTGAGKTTLVNLLPRLYDATGGTVTVKGVNIKNYPLQDLRRMLGVVPQQASLFTGTLRENLGCTAEADDQTIKYALDIAQASEFIEDYDMAVVKGGKNFSGGQRQRLTIARALMHKPEILILDNSASALDYATERKLHHALKNVNAVKILVSQRIRSVKSLDRIVVLEDGEIVGIGTHNQLKSTCEIYREICISQEEMS